MVVFAQEEARSLGHSHIGTEHLLLGLLRAEGGLAAQVLERLGVELDGMRSRVAEVAGEGEGAPAGQIPFAPRAKKALELSLREALALGHNYIGSEHILLGLARENEGMAARVLLDFDLTGDRIREEVLGLLSSGPGRPARFAAPAVGLGRRLARRERWEYLIELWDPLDHDGRLDHLNRLGAEGWELVGAAPGGGSDLIFKRPARPGPPPAARAEPDPERPGNGD